MRHHLILRVIGTFTTDERFGKANGPLVVGGELTETVRAALQHRLRAQLRAAKISAYAVDVVTVSTSHDRDRKEVNYEFKALIFADTPYSAIVHAVEHAMAGCARWRIA